MNVKAAVGAETFAGIAAIEIVRTVVLFASEPIGVAWMTMLPSEPATGAVTANDNVPPAPVTTLVSDNVVPAGALTGIAIVKRWPATGRPCASRAVMVTTDCELPSRGS